MYSRKKLKNIAAMDSVITSCGYDSLFPTTEKIFSFAEDMVNMGPRLAGTEAGVKAQKYVVDKLKEAGIENVDIVGKDTLHYDYSDESLTVAGQNIDVYHIRHSFYDGSLGAFETPEGGLDTEIVYVGDGREKDFANVDVKGKIVMAEVKFPMVPVGMAKLVSYLFYDPDKTFSFFDKKPNPYSPNTFPYNYFNAMKRGAVGFVGILTDYIDSNKFNNEDYSYIEDKMKLPGLWVTKKDGDRIKKLIKAGGGKAAANMTLAVTIKQVQSGAVIGFLPGQSDETIMIQTHYDAVTPGGTEDASGTAVVLALVEFFGKIKKEDRPRTLMFTLMDTHFSDYDSHEAVIDKYMQEGHQILADVSVEHLSREFEERNGKFVYTGLNEPNMIFVSKVPEMIDIAAEEVARHDMKRSIVIKTSLFGEDIPTDSDLFYRHGIPVISSVSGPIYLYDELDTVDKIDIEALLPATKAFANMIWRLSRTDKNALKA